MGEIIQAIGRLAGLCGYDGTDWQKVGISASDRLKVETEASDGTDLKDVLDELGAILTEIGLNLKTADVDIDGQQHLQVDVKKLPGSGLQIRRGNHVSVSYDDVPGTSDVYDLIDISATGVLEWLNLISDTALTRVYINLDTDYTYCVYPPTATDLGYHAPLYYALGAQECSLFKLSIYDTDNDYYGIFLKRPLWFNGSLKVQYRASSAVSKVAINAGYYSF